MLISNSWISQQIFCLKIWIANLDFELQIVLLFALSGQVLICVIGQISTPWFILITWLVRLSLRWISYCVKSHRNWRYFRQYVAYHVSQNHNNMVLPHIIQSDAPNRLTVRLITCPFMPLVPHRTITACWNLDTICIYISTSLIFPGCRWATHSTRLGIFS